MKNMNNWKDTWGMIEFYNAEDDMLNKIQQLLDNGADVNMRNENGDTPLILAVCQENMKCVEKLLASGADINVRGRIDNTALNWAAYRGSKGMVQKLLEHGAKTNLSDKFGFTPLYWAVTCGNKDIIRLLVNAGVDYDDLRRTLACLEEKVNDPWNEEIEEILQCALDKYYEEVAKSNDYDDIFSGSGLVQDSNEEKTEEPVTPIVVVGQSEAVAEETKPAEVTRVVEETTPVIEEKKSVEQKTAKKGLFAALRKMWMFSWQKVKWDELTETQVLEKAQKLIEKGADINASDIYEHTPLMHAAVHDYVKVAKLLLDNGADMDMFNNGGKTALHLAALYGSTATAKFLMENGARINDFDAHKKTPLFVAAKEGNSGVVRVLLNAENIELNIKDENEDTALMVAVKERNEEVVDMLVKAGADVNAKDKKGKTIFNYLNPANTEDRNLLRVIREARKDYEQLVQFEKELKEKERMAILRDVFSEEDENKVLDLLDYDRGAIRAKIAALQALLRQPTPVRKEILEKLNNVFDHKDRRREYARMKQLDHAFKRAKELCR